MDAADQTIPLQASRRSAPEGTQRVHAPLWRRLTHHPADVGPAAVTRGDVGACRVRRSAEASACTESVETVIVEHYKKQIQEIEGSDNKELKKKIEKFLKDEAKHRETGLKNLQNKSLKLKIFKKIVKEITKGAISISERI